MRKRALAVFTLCIAPLSAHAEEATPPHSSEVITVWGQRERQIGVAFSASEGEVEFGRFVDRPLLRTGELAEVVPGLGATQHSGAGKANQYFLRGFNLDHGTDFSISLDGIPLNARTNAHGQGYLDINFLIPEIIDRIRYRKGVAATDSGDFSAAGSARFSTFTTLPEQFAQVEIGENNWRRFVGAANIGTYGYAALDITQDDGPWTRPENLDRKSGFLRLHHGAWSVSAGAYQATWESSDQIPLRAIEAGAIDRLGNIDPDVGGESERYWVNVGYTGERGFDAQIYASHYALQLFSDFTYFLDDPIDGDEFEQFEERMTYGGSMSQAVAITPHWRARFGVEGRYDAIDPIGLYRTAERERLGSVREDSIDQASIGAFADVIGDYGRARVNLGLRADAMHVDVESSDPRNSGSADDAIPSPKLSFAWRFSDNLEGYVSAARGYHSNDARGATITVDPASGDPADRVPLLVQAEGFEAGLRFERDAFSATASVFTLDLDSELVYVGDAGATEASDASQRTGLEVTATWAATDWLTLDAAAATTRARFRDVSPGKDHIPLANTYVITGGATARFGQHWTSSLTVRHLGPAPLIEDNSVRSEASTVVNGRLAWRAGRLTLAAEALNLLDSDDADITYYYASRLPGEPADGVEDIHLHPVPPRSFRLQSRIAF